MAFTAYRMKDIDLILGDEATGPNFKCQVRSALITADVNDDEIKTACPEGTYRDVDAPTYQLELGYIYGKATGADQALWRYLFDHHGEKQAFVFRPYSGDPYGGMSGTVTISTGGMGGEVGSWAEQTVTLPIEGKPTPLDGSAPRDSASPGDTFPAEATVTAEDVTNAGKLAGLGYVADPTTAWTAGQKITVGAYEFSWDGTAWDPGAAA